MATITLTAANVRVGTLGTSSVGTAGEAIASGDLVYLKAGDGKYWKAVNTTEAEADYVGVALSNAEVDVKFAFLNAINGVTGLEHTTGVWTQGKTYVVGDTAGTMMDAADIAAADYVTVVAVASSTTAVVLFRGTTGFTG